MIFVSKTTSHFQQMQKDNRTNKDLMSLVYNRTALIQFVLIKGRRTHAIIMCLINKRYLI